MLLTRDSLWGMYHDYQRMLKTAQTPPNCPGNSTISLTKLMITSVFQQPLFLHLKASHTQLCLRPAIRTTIFLALVSKQCKYSKVPFSSKSHHHCRTKSNSKAAVTNNLHGARCPIICRRTPSLPTQPPPCSLLQLCTQAYYTTTPAFVFWPRDKKNTVD